MKTIQMKTFATLSTSSMLTLTLALVLSPSCPLLVSSFDVQSVSTTRPNFNCGRPTGRRSLHHPSFLPTIIRPSGSVKNSNVMSTSSLKMTDMNMNMNIDAEAAEMKMQTQKKTTCTCTYTWSPQDLTKETLIGYDHDHDDNNDNNFPPIPDDDYIKKYQDNPTDLWPVEFFIIAYRRVHARVRGITSNDPGKSKTQTQTQLLVRESANGTSNYGLGTGVPITRWMISSTANPPRGYVRHEPNISFDACNFPEFPRDMDVDGTSEIENDTDQNWSYDKIQISEHAFHTEFQDDALEAYATQIRDYLKLHIAEEIEASESSSSLSSWERIRLELVQDILHRPNCRAAIQGTLRMSGLFQPKRSRENNGDSGNDDGNADESSPSRYISLGGNDNDNESNSSYIHPRDIAKSVRVYTMFPQMPHPMPLPSTSQAELKEEIQTRPQRMKQTGRDPHRDAYGRTYTHISTSNVSNTIHGIYLTLDVTDILPYNKDENENENENESESDNVPPALDLFGTKEVKRYWKSLEDLKVLDPNTNTSSSSGNDNDDRILTTEDPKPTFISGFIVRQLVREGIIDIHG